MPYPVARENVRKYGWIYSDPQIMPERGSEISNEKLMIAKMWLILLSSNDLNDLRAWYYKRFRFCLYDFVGERYLPCSKQFMNWSPRKIAKKVKRKIMKEQKWSARTHRGIALCAMRRMTSSMFTEQQVE